MNSLESRAATVVVALAVAGFGCKRAAPPDADASAVISEPPVQFIGRCVNETSGTPYQSIFFFPKKGEMFLYLGTTGAMRVPVVVTDEAPRKIEFTFRWSEKDELPATRTGSVTAVANKWQFEFDTLKSSLCRPGPAPDFYKMLPDLGFPAGKWEDKRQHFSIVIAADAQAWILTEKGQNKTINYRIIEHTDEGAVVTSFGKTPGDADDEGWGVTRLTHNGDTIVHEVGDVKLNYKLVTAAPTLK